VVLFTGTLSAMYNNNYHDVEIDRYATQTFFSGGSRILVDHPELRTIVKQLSVFFLVVSIFFGFVGMIFFSYSVTFFLFVLFGNLLAWYYTAPPIQLIYHGLGEIGTMLAVGLLVPGLGYFALANQIDIGYIPLLIPLLFQGFALSFYLEIPDREADRRGHKNTLVVHKGASFGFIIGAISSLFATLCFLSYGFLHVISGNINYLLITVFSLIPLFFCLHSAVRYRSDTTKINPLVLRSAASFFIFYILLDCYFLFVIFLQ
jgi:1,4-dihydroxy-2-naphthoate polyprenyltransferase